MDVKVTDADVKKSFDEQKKQSFPKDADYQKFLKTSGQTRGRHPAARQARPAVEQDPRQGRQGQGHGLRRRDPGLLQQEQGPLRAAREARPARRADQGQGRGRQGLRRARSPATRGRRSPRSTRSTTRRRPPAASSRRRPRARSTSSSTTPSSRAKKSELIGPIKTQYGYYVFAVTGDHAGQPADARRGQGRRSSRRSSPRTSRRRWTRS